VKVKSFESWWERMPSIVRIALMCVSLLAMLLGGAADHYWS
jgi:hypothetical protein